MISNDLEMTLNSIIIFRLTVVASIQYVYLVDLTLIINSMVLKPAISHLCFQVTY